MATSGTGTDGVTDAGLPDGYALRGLLSADEQAAIAAAGAVGYGPFALESRFLPASEFGGVSGLVQPLVVNGAEGHVLEASEKIGIAVRGAWDGVRDIDPETGLAAERAYQ